MTIRCRECHAVVWGEPKSDGDGASTLTCRKCGQTYSLKIRSSLLGGRRRLSARARRIAKQHGLDLPGAYSVLLGIAQPGEMRELGDPGSTPCRTARSPAHEPPGRAIQYDEAFQSAVDAGSLTPRQAAERGDRAAFAGILASRHRLSMDVAYHVADNQLSLLEAIRQRARTETELRLELRSRRIRSAALMAALVAVALFGWVTRDPGVKFVHGEDSEEVLGGAEIRTDPGGRVLQVLGPDPRSVLRAYCAASGRSGRLEPLNVVPSSLPGKGRARVGLLRDPYRPDDLLSITIREELESGHWLAGDGEDPLVAGPAPAGSELAVRRH